MRTMRSSMLIFFLLIAGGLPHAAHAYYGQASYYAQPGYYSQSSYYSPVETFGTWYGTPYGSCAGAGYNSYFTRSRDASGNYVYALYHTWRGDYSGWDPYGDAVPQGNITSSATLGGTYGRDTVHARLRIDASSPHRSGAIFEISGCHGGFGLPTSGAWWDYRSYIYYVVPHQAPTCSVSVDSSTITYGGSTTLRWSSWNANTSFYISNIGYVTPEVSGSATVSPTSNTTYTGTASGTGGTTQCSVTLNVNTPANCTFNGSTVSHGGSVTAYQASSVAAGQSCVSETRTCTNGSLSGSYTYASCAQAPTASLSLSPSTIAQGESATLTWTSTNATSCTGDNFETGGATVGSVSVSPSQSTTYTGSCTGPGGTVSFSLQGTTNGSGAPLTVTCTPTYQCGGADGQSVLYTDNSCNTVTLTSCTAPQFCANGSASCLILNPTGWIDASPKLVITGAKSQISWSTSDTVSCTVSGNGDSWTGTSGSQQSRPITFFATYSLACDDGDVDSVQDDLTDSVTIVRIPGWRER